jgi:hypothetical protein
MKPTFRNSISYHFARWIFAMLLTPLVCSAVDGSFPDRNVEMLANVGRLIPLPRTSPSGISVSGWGAPISPELYGPFHGTALGGGGSPSALYTPNEDFVGRDQFKYNVRLVDGRIFEGMVIIAVKNGISISDTSIAETTTGTRAATFSVNLRAPASELNVVSVSYRTVAGTAREGSDYIGTSGTLNFAPGSRSQTVSVQVTGDLFTESSETFFVQLFNPSANAVLTDGTGVGTILDFSGSRTSVGTAALAPVNPVAEVDEPVILNFSWTHPVGWRQLESIDLLMTDDEDQVMAVRWNEAENSFSLYNPATDRFIRTARAGSPAHFETFAATMFLEESTGGGPPGQTVTIRYGLVFKPQAARRTFRVETFATDDAGKQQGFEQVGTITVLRH